ncbi:histidinol dehydrogenase [bacterium]|nr:histidinol dehydrogenase [bacterium]
MKIFEWPWQKSEVKEFFGVVSETPADIERAVDQIIDQVRKGGDSAVSKLMKKFDGVEIFPGDFNVPKQRLAAAWRSAPAELKHALKTAKERIEAFHGCQRLTGWKIMDPDFGRIEQRVLALQRVAVYVPAGKAPLVSTVLMNVIPAKVAGVKEIILVTPPGPDGWPNPGILAAAHLVGVDRVLRVGGSPAMPALAYGTETIPRVDKVVGPGNIFVTTAKKRLYGRFDIESTAGPSEVLILADETARLDWIAADMLAQAEHDGNNPAGAVLIGGGKRRAEALAKEVARQAAELPRRELAESSLDRWGYIISAKTAEQALELADMKAPEHLEIVAKNARKMAAKVRNAGAVFVGPWTPEPVGDYIAGPNHTLPTGGTARFFSPLSVWSFYRTSHTVEASRKGLFSLADDITTLAESEQLTAHAKAVKIRTR